MNIRETLDRIAPESEAVDLSDLSTYARGYLDAENKYLRMIADGELVEVVRCKDCKYKKVYRFPPQYQERDYCVKHEKTVDVADFCSWAERRAE